MKQIFTAILWIGAFISQLHSQTSTEPYSIELERVNMPGTPSIHSFAFAQSNGKWLFVGGRTNGLHGFNPGDAFPKQYSNKNIFVVDPNTAATWSKNIFADIPFSLADPLRSTNMEYFQDGNKLYMIGGYGYDSASNGLVTFPRVTVLDIDEVIQATISGTSVSQYVRQVTDSRLQVCGGELQKLGDYFYLTGGHKFTGTYTRTINNQIYTNQLKKFKINDDGTSVNITDYETFTDTALFHRRDMNLVPSIKSDGTTPYLTLYGGVFKYNQDIPYTKPIYIEKGAYSYDNSFEQKMSQYSCANLSAFNIITGSFHTTFFGGVSLYYYNENTHSQVYDSLVPFIDDITTLTKNSQGISEEKISPTKMPALLGANAKFILDQSVPHYSNGVIKFNELSGRTFAGYIYGGIRALLPNTTPTFPSDYILKVYITPTKSNIKHIGNTVPSQYKLSQNYPNPFNPKTIINYQIPSTDFITIKIFDELGNEIITLVNEKENAGIYEVDFDGSKLPSGVYFYKMEGNAFVETKKMLLIK